MQRVLVTGANRGLGLEFVRQLLARGDRVIATCRHPGRASELTLQAAAHPGHLHVLPLDVTKPASITELAREAAMLFDGLDLLINNAGQLVPGERFGSVAADNLDASFRSNAIGPLLLTQALTPLLARGKPARVASLSSVIGSIASTREFRNPSYAMSKAALNMATKLLAPALAAEGVSVMALHPGWVNTDMGGAQAPLTPPESVAGLLQVIAALTPERSGEFRDWQGAIVPW
jgi:NAD(P)-dependent dehydrogenase (short-subunit alcohol dehydrogenase family)